MEQIGSLYKDKVAHQRRPLHIQLSAQKPEMPAQLHLIAPSSLPRLTVLYPFQTALYDYGIEPLEIGMVKISAIEGGKCSFKPTQLNGLVLIKLLWWLDILNNPHLLKTTLRKTQIHQSFAQIWNTNKILK